MKFSQPLRIEDPTVGSFITSRTVNSKLWFVNNEKFEQRVLGYVAKYVEKYSVNLNALVFQGNHCHLGASFPGKNRGDFMRDLNARSAEAVRFTVKEYEGGPVFGRRYSEQVVVTSADMEDRFFYCALQPVNAGLCQRISEYPGYNSFTDAAAQIVRHYKVINWAGYHREQRYNPAARIKDYTKYYPLKYTKLPSHAHLSRAEYKKTLHNILEIKRLAIIKKKQSLGYQYPDPSFLKEVIPGSSPRTTKKDEPYKSRPLIFCSDPELRKEHLSWRRTVCLQYKEASKAYLAGDASAKFPPNTYKPPCFFVDPQPE